MPNQEMGIPFLQGQTFGGFCIKVSLDLWFYKHFFHSLKKCMVTGAFLLLELLGVFQHMIADVGSFDGFCEMQNWTALTKWSNVLYLPEYVNLIVVVPQAEQILSLQVCRSCERALCRLAREFL
jgi:hypothetical protein